MLITVAPGICRIRPMSSKDMWVAPLKAISTPGSEPITVMWFPAKAPESISWSKQRLVAKGAKE